MAINKYELTAEKRSDMGKGASRRLRRENKIPAIVYGAGKDAEPVALVHHHVTKALENEAFYSHILTLSVGNDKQKVVLKDMQRHPFEPRISHMDFLRISDTEKIIMHVPLHFKNADIAPGVKKDGGIVTHRLTNVEVSCLPADLPEFIEVDLANLELNEAIHLSHLQVPKGVELVMLSHGNDIDVASIHIPRAVVEEIAAPVAIEVPATAQKAPEVKAEGKVEGKPDAKSEGKDKK